MNDPSKPPGFDFVALRLKSAAVQVLEDPDAGVEAKVQSRYSDSTSVAGNMVGIVQRVDVRLVSSADESKLFLVAHAEVEAVFSGSEHPNLSPEEFAQKAAPTILFPFVREWIHKLTSQSGSFAPVLLSPLNVLAVRQAAQAEAAKGSKPE